MENQTASPIKIPSNGGTIDLPIETRAAPINSIDQDSRTVEVTWTTGAGFPRYDWISDTRYIEELDVSDKAIRLDRLNAGAPVLNSHRMHDLSNQVAVVEKAWIAGKNGLAQVRFPKAEDDPDADLIFRKVSDKIIRSLSCGYRRLKIEVDKSKNPQVWRVVDWEPFELSFVTVPVDIGAQVRNADTPRHGCNFVTVGGDSGGIAARARISMRQNQLNLTR